jgi:surfactin synthase thioesterase subunit
VIASPWYRIYDRRVTGPVRLVCFPHAGGSAAYYRFIAEHVGHLAQVLGVQYPGRLDRFTEPCVDDLDLLADSIYPALSGLPPMPTAYFGHSMGAVLAFEVARRLERAGGELTHLFLSGRRAPSRPKRDTDVDALTDTEVVAMLERLGGTSSQVLAIPEMLDALMPSIRADYRALWRYRSDPSATVTAPVTALVGDADPVVTVSEVGSWSSHTGGRFDLKVFPGGHFYLSAMPEAVTGTILAELSR